MSSSSPGLLLHDKKRPQRPEEHQTSCLPRKLPARGVGSFRFGLVYNYRHVAGTTQVPGQAGWAEVDCQAGAGGGGVSQLGEGSLLEVNSDLARRPDAFHTCPL